MVVRVNASPIAKVACTAAGCVVLAAVAGASSGAADPAPPQRLTATVSGAAFAASPIDDGMPVMSIHDLAPGRGTSGMVTVRNPTDRSRFFWLSQAGVSDRIGAVGGRLSGSLQLAVLDMTRLSSPTSIYRGSAVAMGGRPLGFLPAGASRTYSFTATVPESKGLPGSPGSNPYAGSTTALTYAWRAIEGYPAPRPAVPRVARAKAVGKPGHDSRAPSISIAVPRSQRLLEAHALDFSISCGKGCRKKVQGTVRTGAGRWTLPATASPSGHGRQSLRLDPPAYAAVRSSLLGGHDVFIELSVRAWDRAGNRAHKRHSIRLESAR